LRRSRIGPRSTTRSPLRELDLHLLADEEAARHGHVPDEPPLTPVEPRGRVEADALLHVRILDNAERLNVHLDRLRHVADREVAACEPVVVARALDLRALERDLGVLLGVEEVRRAQMPVTFGIADSKP